MAGGHGSGGGHWNGGERGIGVIFAGYPYPYPPCYPYPYCEYGSEMRNPEMKAYMFEGRKPAAKKTSK